MKLRIQKLHPSAPVPVYSTDGAAAFDLFATTVNGSETAGDYVTPDHPVVVGTALAEIERIKEEATRSERRAVVFGDILHNQILAMRAAVVAWKQEDATAGMKWIANTLDGPGHLPSEEDIAMGAQSLFDKESAEHEAFRAAHPAP